MIQNNFPFDLMLLKKPIATKWDHHKLIPWNPHGYHFIDISFETTAPLFKILKQWNGFISLSNTCSSIYQISLEIELYWYSVRVFFAVKYGNLLACIFTSYDFLFKLNLFFSLALRNFKISIQISLGKVRFEFSKLCRMGNEDFVSKRANCIQQIQQASLTI